MPDKVKFWGFGHFLAVSRKLCIMSNTIFVGRGPKHGRTNIIMRNIPEERYPAKVHRNLYFDTHIDYVTGFSHSLSFPNYTYRVHM